MEYYFQLEVKYLIKLST